MDGDLDGDDRGFLPLDLLLEDEKEALGYIYKAYNENRDLDVAGLGRSLGARQSEANKIVEGLLIKGFLKQKPSIPAGSIPQLSNKGQIACRQMVNPKILDPQQELMAQIEKHLGEPDSVREAMHRSKMVLRTLQNMRTRPINDRQVRRAILKRLIEVRGDAGPDGSIRIINIAAELGLDQDGSLRVAKEMVEAGEIDFSTATSAASISTASWHASQRSWLSKTVSVLNQPIVTTILGGLILAYLIWTFGLSGN